MNYESTEEEFEFWDMFGEQNTDNLNESTGIDNKTLGFNSADELLNE